MKGVLFSLLFFIVLQVHAQPPGWAWARSPISTFSAQEGNAVATDATGNAYITGNFSGVALDFDNGHVIFGVGLIDLYLAKYDSSGNAVMAVSAGTPNGGLSGDAICVDRSGNIYICGYFVGAHVILGNDTLINASNGSSDIFVVKYSPAGNILWARGAGGQGDDLCTSVSADADGNVYIAGSFRDSTIVFGNDTLINCGVYNAFIVKYDSLGNALWARTASGNTGTLGITGCAVSADTKGNVFFAGQFNPPSVSFGTITLNNTGSNSLVTGSNSLFLVKYDNSGNVLWAKYPTGPVNVICTSITTDPVGNVYVTGGFANSFIVFENDTLTNMITSNGALDYLLVKYSSGGNVLWARSGGRGFGDYAWSVSVGGGNVFISGQMGDSSITFGSQTYHYPPGSGDPMFIAQYDTSGVILCGDALGSGGDDQNGISADPFGNAYITGDFEIHYFVIGTSTLALTSPTEGTFIARWNSSAETNASFTACDSLSIRTTRTGVQTYNWSDGSLTPVKTFTVSGTFTEELIYTNGCLAHNSFTVTVDKSHDNFVMPNIVTPNDDKINDVIDFGAYGFSSLEITIYNRWGQKIFETNDVNAVWRPTSVDGTYFYLAKYSFDCGGAANGKNVQGFITIIR